MSQCEGAVRIRQIGAWLSLKVGGAVRGTSLRWGRSRLVGAWWLHGVWDLGERQFACFLDGVCVGVACWLLRVHFLDFVDVHVASGSAVGGLMLGRRVFCYLAKGVCCE